MVQPKSKVALFFAAFVLPALLLYGLFFLYPFAQGIRISFTNWDGLTPRLPISMPRVEFEKKILDKVTAPADRAVLLRFYRLDPADGKFKRFAVTGLSRYRLQRIIRGTGFEPESYRTVGLGNYAQIFTGKVEERFYPHSYTRVNYNENSDLPPSIAKGDFERKILPSLKTGAERTLVQDAYAAGADGYSLKPGYDELTLEDRIWLLPEIETAKTVPSEAVDALVSAVREAGLKQDPAALAGAVAAFTGDHALSEASRAEIGSAAREIYTIGALKRTLAAAWVERKFEMGVIGFTIFFMVISVLGSNVLALFLALALDSGIRSQRVLRSLFFLPNVLSMIVVALIWSFVFYNLLPALTGIDKWMGDPGKAPWLVVMVQVWQQAGYLMVIYLAGLSNIPTDVLEAASIDGTGFGARLRHITLPLLVPAFTICLFMSISNALKCFDLVYAMVGPSGYALGTIPFVMDIFFDAFAKKLAGLATAKAVLLFLAIALITGVQLAITKRREVQM